MLRYPIWFSDYWLHFFHSVFVVDILNIHSFYHNIPFQNWIYVIIASALFTMLSNLIFPPNSVEIKFNLKMCEIKTDQFSLQNSGSRQTGTFSPQQRRKIYYLTWRKNTLYIFRCDSISTIDHVCQSLSITLSI